MQDPRYFFKYVSGDVAQVILEQQTLRWSAPSRFNDIFDVPRILKFGYSSQELASALRESVASLIELGAQDPPFAQLQTRKFLRNIRLTVNVYGDSFAQIAAAVRAGDPELLRLTNIDLDWIQDYWRRLTSRMRILCMTEKCDSKTMWAYYGDHSRGAVFGFEPLESGTFGTLRAVQYAKSPPKLLPKEELARYLLGERELDWEAFFHELQFTKDAEFAHECEWRSVQRARAGEKDDYGVYRFRKDELRRIILGPKCPHFTRKRILELLRHRRWRHVVVHQALVDDWQMTLEPIV